MTFDELARQANAGSIEELNLISIEGGIYLLEARSGERATLLKDERGNARHLRSVEHARQVLEPIPVLPFHLVHASAHDEMCGLGDRAEAPLRVPIAFRSHL